MKIPHSASEKPTIKPIDLPEGAYIKNPFPEKEMLTFEESIHCIHMLSSMMRIDFTIRKH